MLAAWILHGVEMILSSEEAVKTQQNGEKEVNSKAKKPPSAVSKDPRSAQRPDKGLRQAERGPKGAAKIPSPDTKRERLAESRDQQNGDGPSQRHKHKAEKRKAMDAYVQPGKWTNKNKRVEEEKKPTEPDIWFDDVDPDDIEATVGAEAADVVRKRSSVASIERVLIKEHAFEGLTRAIAVDCEMVGVGPDGEESMLARVSIVNQFGKCLYDKYVRPMEPVTDYRTAVSGIRPADIENGEDFKTVQQEVAQILEGRILVGHAIHNDLKILLLDHPKKMIRDTQKYKPFKKIAKSGRPALRVLCREVLNVKVQQGEHSSVQDAQATMRLYTLVKKQWEAELKASMGQRKDPKSPRKPRAKTDPGKAQTQTRETHDQ
ncbi:RNA exonuclease 4 isoform X2 [Electrophorus electricus]|uniref:RNA exonuclease 4 isoform X2 n=1 Tax=Electrophorus electricus TaxID=8005 RepID=UPI0015D0685B|nr:RNA exonuclease 4 isoform X2 [Electrophorus electricus]